MISGSGGEDAADSIQGLPDAHVTVKYPTPKSKVQNPDRRSWAFYQGLKSKLGLAAPKAAALLKRERRRL